MTVENEKFHSVLESIMKEIIQKQIGDLSDSMDLALKKLVVLQKGGRISPDLLTTEEENFITVIAQLPSLFTGNAQTISYDDQIKQTQFNNSDSKFEILYSAFYSTCKFETMPLESGYRLCLIFKVTLDSMANSIIRYKESKTKIQKIASSLSQVPWIELHSYFKSLRCI